MRYLLLTIILLFSIFGTMSAQETETIQDSAIIKAPVMDSTFFKKDIFSMLLERGSYSNGIKVQQTESLRNAFDNHIVLAASKRITGYRVRIFFDNSQSARGRSSSVKTNFLASYPDIPAYWTYDEIYYKVTVGDFRTKSEAMIMLKKLQPDFPSAFLVKMPINFPPL